MTQNPDQLTHDVHLGLLESSAIHGCTVETVKGPYAYYHYLCDGVDDRGWGCGYRTCQTICSWIHYQKRKSENVEDQYSRKAKGNVPSVNEIQEILVKLGDKEASFLNSKEWIGSVEISMCIDYLYDVSCKLLHVLPGHLKDHVNLLCKHFKDYGSPVMMGGDCDNSSKGLLGIAIGPEQSSPRFLILDPHCVKFEKPEDLVQQNWVSWRSLSEFDEKSFYNLCLPLLS